MSAERDLDREIDRAVRTMLDAEPPIGLRRRVLASLDDRKPHPFALASLVPIVFVGIVLVLALVLRPWRSAPSAPVTAASAHDVRLPPMIVQPAAAAPPESATVARLTTQSSRVLKARAPASAPAGEPEDAGIAALARPPALSVKTIAAPEVTVMPSIQPAPLRVTALDLRALEMPPETARGADR